MLLDKNCTVMRYVIPFAWEGSYQTQYTALENDQRWQSTPITKADVSLLPHMLETLHSQPAQNGIGSCWSYDFRNKRPKLQYQEPGAEPVALQIREMGIYLFYTNVGFLWYEPDLSRCREEMDAAQLIRLQNRFKECSYTKDFFSLEQPRTEKAEPVYAPLDLATWLAETLTPLGQLLFLNGSCRKGDRLCPGKALIFQYALFREGDRAALTDAAYHLANGYTEKYLPPESMGQTVYEPFRDVCIYASHSGCGVYALENAGNSGFYSGNFAGNIRREYFAMYVLALYQSFSLMNYTRISGQRFPADPALYRGSGELREQLDQFLGELNTFLMKGFHTTVSNVQHHNEFYEYLKGRLMIREDIDSIRTGTEALVELQRAAEEEEEIRRDRALNMAVAAFSLPAVLSAFLDLGELIQTGKGISWEDLLQKLCQLDLSTIFAVVGSLGILALTISCIVVFFRTYPSKKKKKKKKSR